MPDHCTEAKPQHVRRPAHLLYFAAVPPPEIKSRMASAWKTAGTGEPFRHDTLHLSIFAVAGLDHLDRVLVRRARQAALLLRTGPFPLCFDRLMTFNGSPGNLPLVIATERISSDLNQVAAELRAACHAMSLTASRSARVTPHVTLAYGRGFTGKRRLARPIFWTIDEITLIDSHHGRGRHVPLGRWALPPDRQEPRFQF